MEQTSVGLHIDDLLEGLQDGVQLIQNLLGSRVSDRKDDLFKDLVYFVVKIKKRLDGDGLLQEVLLFAYFLTKCLGVQIDPGLDQLGGLLLVALARLGQSLLLRLNEIYRYSHIDRIK